ncbi:TetR/AcrR family transcriptional regulator [Mucilaginibacter sp. L196]|uniref:TetR/AcrR family transcriptional regulator n=1 Tax=Mucilaginibacter sp. L196 TaxID=1641870 RepID=UPI00131C8D21|nr:TetR/AcrR family transcriptional regulator [Mucilaginibacter sp. L196]
MPGKRNPDDKKTKLIGAVGETLKENGYHGLTLNKVTLRAGVSKPMVYEYFANFNGLLKAYIAGKDSWVAYFESLELPEKPTTAELKNCFIKMLQDQFRYFHQDAEMQKLVHWQVSEYNPLMRATCENREREGVRLLELADGHFRNSGISLKTVMALLVGGIYYNVLHDSAGLGTMAGTDIRNQKDFDQILKTIGQVIGWAFDAAELANSR